MRVNVGLPGPVSVGGEAPKGCGTVLLLAFLPITLFCVCGVAFQLIWR